MNHNNLRTFNHYFKRFLNSSFGIAGVIYFIFIFVAMTTIPTMKSTDISHNSQISTLKLAEAFQMSLGFWQLMFWFPIIGGLAFTIIEGSMTYSKRRHQSRNTAKN